jgi:hypothetical protein
MSAAIEASAAASGRAAPARRRSTVASSSRVLRSMSGPAPD